MKTVREHITYVRSKPHHIRKRVAFAAAAAGTALIALIWLTASLGTGAFALKDASFAQSAAAVAPVVVSNDATPPNIAGAAAAVPSGASASSAHIEIVDTNPPASSGNKTRETTLPF